MSIFTGAPPVRVLALWGSLRADSSNTAPLRAALALVPSGLTTSTSQPLALPLFDEELETCDAPEAVRHLKSVAQAADASLIATPEYRASVTGVLKDALDWLLRPTRGEQFRAKPAAILGGSPSLVGTARMQAPPHLAAPDSPRLSFSRRRRRRASSPPANAYLSSPIPIDASGSPPFWRRLASSRGRKPSWQKAA